MTKNRAEDMVCKQDLGNWEVLEFETENFDSSLDETPRRTVVLVGESSQLIDGCEGLPNAEWDELVAMLEEEQSAFGDRGVDAGKACEISDASNRTRDHDAVGERDALLAEVPGLHRR
jgi:hypothetical protein